MLALRRAALALLISTVPIAALAQSAVQGHIVVGRPSHGAIVVWDATPDVIEIVHGKLSDQAANDKLERDGLRVLASRLYVLDTNNPSITLRITYQKIAAVNSEYGNSTFAGVEEYATIILDGKSAFAKRNRWTTLPNGAPVPAWVKFRIAGRLPPR